MLSKAVVYTQAFFFALFPSMAHATTDPSSISVFGWPFHSSDMAAMVLNRDPLMGTLVCPSLTRLNLLKEKSEPILLSKVEALDKEWRMTLRSDLRWWDGQAVQAVDLENFLKDQLPAAINEIGHGEWKVPSFSLNREGNDLRVKWEERPDFGPFILNRMPFRLPAKHSLGFQCVGDLQPTLQGNDWVLKGSSVPSMRLLQESIPHKRGAAGRFVAFRFGEEIHPPGWGRQIDEGVVCERPLDLPMMSLVAWNPNGRWTRDERFRRAMTHLLPRGAILRAGAGALGDLVSAPFVRAHPGYNRSLLVPAYDPKKADILLNQIGFKRSEVDGFRRTAEGQTLDLKIAIHNLEGSGLLRKVLDDSFRALGISASFSDKEQEQVDGVLVAVVSSWPEADLSSLLHSKGAARTWPWLY